MAYDKVVDSAKLDADLTMVADAIRARAGTSEPLAFPEGMKDAVEGIADFLEARCMGTLTEYRNDRITKVDNGAFDYSSLTSCELPNVVTVGTRSFYNCTSLSELKLPNLEVIVGQSIGWCTKLEELRLPKLRRIEGSCALNGSKLYRLILDCENGIPSMAKNALTDTLSETQISSGSGYVYVPRAYVNEIKVATNWSSIADKIRAIEDYPEITGG